MKYSFKFKLTNIDFFNSSINFMFFTKTIFFDILFTIIAILATIYTIYTKAFFTFSLVRKMLLIVCMILFPIIQPLLLYIKSYQRFNSLTNNEVSIVFNDISVILSSSTENATVLYKNIYNFIKFKNMIVIMFDSIHGQILPDRIFNNNKDEFYEFVSNKIKQARTNDEK